MSPGFERLFLVFAGTAFPPLPVGVETPFPALVFFFPFILDATNFVFDFVPDEEAFVAGVFSSCFCFCPDVDSLDDRGTAFLGDD